MNLIVIYIWSSWKLACIKRTYRTYNSTVRFSKYEFNNKLLGVVTLIIVTQSVTSIQPYMCVCVCVCVCDVLVSNHPKKLKLFFVLVFCV